FSLLDFDCQCGKVRQLCSVLPLPEPDNLLDTEQRVNIDRKDMVEVVLDLAVYPFELGYEVVQKPDVMHKLERLHYPLVRPENIEEGAVYLPAPPEFVVYKIDP